MERIVEIPDNIKRTKAEPFSMASITGMPVREEIVRCRDCKHSMDAGTICLGRAYRPAEPSEERVHVVYSKVVPDGFCWLGERRG